MLAYVAAPLGINKGLGAPWTILWRLEPGPPVDSLILGFYGAVKIEEEWSMSLKIEINAEFEEMTAEQAWPKLAAYVFTRRGRFLGKKVLGQDPRKPEIGRAAVKVDDGQGDLLVKLGPDVEEIADLSLYHLPVEPVVVTPEGKAVAAFKIPKSWWWCWIRVPYLVTGKVEKGDAPICCGEVDIYDVDIGNCFIRLPDIIIEKIRDALIDVIHDPPRIREPHLLAPWGDDDWCGTRPRPPVPPPPPEDIVKRLGRLPREWDFARRRYAALPEARARMSVTLDRLSPEARQAMLDREAVEGVKIKDVFYSNTNQFRDLLIKRFLAFRYWLCWWPWIYWLWWPHCWWYSLEKIGTAQLQPDGSFAKTVFLSICRLDLPDLWFVVRQEIGGAERVIYAHHPVPCNTLWNHPNGKAVNLHVTDPAAVACDPEIAPGLAGVYVMPWGIGWDKWYQVIQAHRKPPAPTQPLPARDAKRGLFDATDPFDNGTDPYGTTLHLRMQFHDSLRSIGVHYYRWSYRKEGEPTWIQFDATIVHSYLTVDSLGKPFIDWEKLGPNPAPVGTEKNLFWVPDPNKVWVYDRVFAFWDTSKLADGNFELLLEMFDTSGARVTQAAGFKYFLPTGPAPSPVDDNLYEEPGGGIIFQIHVNNRSTVAEVLSVKLSGVPAAECQFLAYNNKSEEVGVEYVAYHPNDFLDHYDLSILRGISGTSVAAWPSVTTPEPAPATKSWTVDDLLRQVDSNGPHDQCTFAVELHTWPRTRDGYNRIRAYEDHDTATFALVNAKGGS
jgi:hypothetical protein